MHHGLLAISLGIVLTMSASLVGQEKTWAIALHGGAADISRDISAEKQALYKKGLSEALSIGQKILSEGGSSLDAVEATVRSLEDNPMFNAGRGAVFNQLGENELDACIMDGSTMQCGAVASVRRLKNPITAARKVMENSTYVLLAGEHADEFAIAQGCQEVPNSYFFTKLRFKTLQQTLKANNLPPLSEPAYGFPSGSSPEGAIEESFQEIGNTVGCVALDLHGNLAAATSTGGRGGKLPGRIGDSPIAGAGNFADENVAVSGTGIGEEYIRHSITASVAWQVRYLNRSIDESCSFCLDKVLKKGDGGIIAVDRQGNITTPYSTGSMCRGAADSSGRFDVAIWEEPLK